MDAHSRSPGLPLLRSHVLILLIIASLCINSCYSRPASSVRSIIASDDEEKVNLELYYESLCPFSANFVVTQLYKIFENGIIDITNLKLVPFGNAHITNGTVVCQHGEDECFFNMVEACVIDSWPAPKKYFPFIHCVEDLVIKENYSNWEICFEKSGLDRKPVDECFESGKAKELEVGHAAETNILHPRKTYVPWVVVDGKPLYEDFEKYDVAICKAYKGNSRPSVCSDLVGVSIKRWKKNNFSSSFLRKGLRSSPHFQA